MDIALGEDFVLAWEDETWTLAISAAGTMIDRVPMDATWSFDWGASTNLDPAHVDVDDNDLATSWCVATSTFGHWEQRGTPGAANDDCPDDNDGDGWTEDIDCDDDDPTVYPGASDRPYDGGDADCAGDSDYDADGDGWDSDAHGGADCDDLDADIRPDAFDLPDDDIDQDCDGSDATGFIVLTVDDLAAGDLVITEMMPWPGAAPDAPWFEVDNLTGEAVLLEDLRINTLEGWHTVSSALVVDADDRVVFGTYADLDRNGGVPVDYADTDLILSIEEEGTLQLMAGRTVIDEVTWSLGDWPVDLGASTSLGPAHTDADENDDATHWCLGTDPFGDGDLGSPGEVNPEC